MELCGFWNCKKTKNYFKVQKKNNNSKGMTFFNWYKKESPLSMRMGIPQYLYEDILEKFYYENELIKVM